MIQTIIISALAVWISAWLLPDVSITPWYVSLVVAVVLGIINAIVKPLVKLISLPVTVVTFGLFLLVINGLMVLLCAHFVPGFTVESLWAGILFSIILSVVTYFLDLIFGK